MMAGTNVVDMTLQSERVAEWDEPSLERLYHEIARPVLSVAMNILGNREAAEDVLHDVYIKLIDKGAAFQGRSTLKTWIYRVTVNECLSLKRKIKTRVAAGVKIFSESRRSEQQRGENLLMAEEFLKSLDEFTRTVVVLKHVEELTYEEISQITGRPVGSLKSIVSRSLNKSGGD